MTDRYAVMGNPIGHSKSPRIHTLFAQQTGQDLEYSAELVEPGSFPDAVRAFRAAGGRGLNVTVPFKQEAFELADALSDRAGYAGAVNTLILDGDGIGGDNTDGLGLVRDIAVNNGFELSGRRILVLGAGGAVRGVLGPVLDLAPAHLVIANRTVLKAHELADVFTELGDVRGCGYTDLAGQRFDVIINGTAAGLSGEIPPLPDDILEPGGFCYDMVYSDEPTAFVRWARDHGAGTATDGLGMLVEQAAESFHIWRGVRPETGPVMRALRPG